MDQSTIEEAIAPLIRDHAPVSSERIVWQEGRIELELKTYLTNALSPDALTTSGHCIVLTDTSVLMMHSPGGAHILPGGRREAGESAREATIREVAEETGLRIEPLRQIGLRVFRHLTPKPSDYPYPYPIFANIVYVGLAPIGAQVSVNDAYELAGEFVGFNDSSINGLPNHQQMLLAAAVQSETA